MTRPSAESNLLHSRIKKAAAKILFERYPVEKALLWPMVREQIRTERGISCNLLWSATRAQVLSTMVAGREAEWAEIRAAVRPAIEEQMGWRDKRLPANKT